MLYVENIKSVFKLENWGESADFFFQENRIDYFSQFNSLIIFDLLIQ